jgi:ABC-2 type transport system permease protein
MASLHLITHVIHDPLAFLLGLALPIVVIVVIDIVRRRATARRNQSDAALAPPEPAQPSSPVASLAVTVDDPLPVDLLPFDVLIPAPSRSDQVAEPVDVPAPAQEEAKPAEVTGPVEVVQPVEAAELVDVAPLAQETKPSEVAQAAEVPTAAAHEAAPVDQPAPAEAQAAVVEPEQTELAEALATVAFAPRASESTELATVARRQPALRAQRKALVLSEDAFPPVSRRFGENSVRVLFPHLAAQTTRLLIRLIRDPMTFIFGLVLPIAFLLVLNIVLGDAIKTVTGDSALYGSVPLVMLIGAMNGATVGVVVIVAERNDGLLARLWAVPSHRASGLLARIVSEAIRVVVNSTVLLCVGLVLGLRFQQGVLAGLAWLFVPVVFGMAFAMLALTVAVYWPSTVLVDLITLVSALLLFFCTGFVPLAQYPRWVQPFVEHQPLSYATDAMRGLSLGGSVLTPVLGTLLWAGGIAVVCTLPMVFGYRRASMRG